jgi:predicted amidohydrolase
MKTVALIQMTSGPDVGSNLRFVETALREARNCGACMAFLPENFAVLGSPGMREIAAGEATPAGPIRGFLAAQAKELGLWIQGGTLPVPVRPDGAEVPGGRLRAASFVYDDQGREVARYDKLHMFDVQVEDSQGRYRESDTYEAGDRLVVADTPLGRLGLTVCYDIRFPELYRALLHRGAELFSIPAAFTRPTGEAHWQALVRARAIENFAHVLAAAQWGVHPSGRETWGESIAVEPWGRILGRRPAGTGALVVELDPAAASAPRRDIPVASHARLRVLFEPGAAPGQGTPASSSSERSS